VWNDLANRCVRTVPLKPLIKTKLNEKQNHLSKSCFAVLGMSGFSLHQMYRTAHHQYKIYLWNILKLKARRPRSRCVSFWNLLHLGKLRTMRDWKQNHLKLKKNWKLWHVFEQNVIENEFSRWLTLWQFTILIQIIRNLFFFPSEQSGNKAACRSINCSTFFLMSSKTEKQIKMSASKCGKLHERLCFFQFLR